MRYRSRHSSGRASGYDFPLPSCLSARVVRNTFRSNLTIEPSVLNRPFAYPVPSGRAPEADRTVCPNAQISRASRLLAPGRSSSDKPANRLFRHPGLQGAEGRRLSCHPGQFEPSDDHDRSGIRRRHLCRTRHAELVAKIIEREKPDAILPTMGGQTGLNTALSLAKMGALTPTGWN